MTDPVKRESVGFRIGKKKVLTRHQCGNCPQEARHDILIEGIGWRKVCDNHLWDFIGRILGGYSFERIQLDGE